MIVLTFIYKGKAFVRYKWLLKALD